MRSRAVPILIDVSASDWNLDPRMLAEAIGPRTQAILASHLHGGCVRPWKSRPSHEGASAWSRMRLRFLARWSRGGTRETWGVGVLSFGGSKLLTAGRGGAIHSEIART